ncbi:MAG: coproporphyrinogen dehydrogenase HemZ [Lachnospiraceae bacterium]|nr:coproporphyrinogen dehydrogenase HemZ [Lachnospiraceae bacterium]
MLVVTTNQNDFEPDIHSLVKAFYPSSYVKVFMGDDADCVTVSSDPGLPDININFIEGRILLMLHLEEDFLVNGIDIDEKMNRLDVKNALKQLIYHCLSFLTAKELPWGALTGIRPVKIAMNLLKSGLGDDEIINHMQEVYFCSNEKALLALEIAKREREELGKIDLNNSYSLYIGIPFCPTTCLYCSFTSYPLEKSKHLVGEYLEALFKEIDFVADIYKEKQLTTIYVGGGTPTTLTAPELEQLLKKIAASFDLNNLIEFTVEAGRPDSITREKLLVLRKYKVDRISVNPQSMNDKTLDLIGRKHTANQVKEAFALVRESGFENINMDLILGLPEEDAFDVGLTLNAVKELRPDSLTVHSLAIKRASKLTEWVNENGSDSLNNTDETMKMAAELAQELNMHPYYLYRQKNTAGNFENVGYAGCGKYGLYNILMMEEVQTIIALGAGSVSKRVFRDGHIERSDNLKEVGGYIAGIDEMISRKRELFMSS